MDTVLQGIPHVICYLDDILVVHYEPSLPITLTGDASAYGIGAVISHVLHDGSEKPIAFASRSLPPSKRNYTQIEKEALSHFCCQEIHQYLYGRKFQLVNDHNPLLAILGPSTTLGCATISIPLRDLLQENRQTCQCK
jgi:hypothetical protein